LLVRRHIVAGEFHYIGKEASTRWAGGPDPSMMADAGSLDPADETCREYQRVERASPAWEFRKRTIKTAMRLHSGIGSGSLAGLHPDSLVPAAITIPRLGCANAFT